MFLIADAFKEKHVFCFIRCCNWLRIIAEECFRLRNNQFMFKYVIVSVSARSSTSPAQHQSTFDRNNLTLLCHFRKYFSVIEDSSCIAIIKDMFSYLWRIKRSRESMCSHIASNRIAID